ncbi:MAG: type II secretion system protein, partial [Actinomycetota bacterium]
MFKAFSKKGDSGYTLIEVVVAIALLGFVALAILNSVSTGTKTASKIVVKQEPFLAISAAGEIIAQTKFVACNANNPNPYSTLALPSRAEATVAIVGVSAIDKNGSIVPCSDWPEGKPASMLQQIQLTVTDSNSNTATRTISKLFSSQTSEYGNSGDFKVQSLRISPIASGTT